MQLIIRLSLVSLIALTACREKTSAPAPGTESTSAGTAPDKAPPKAPVPSTKAPPALTPNATNAPPPPPAPRPEDPSWVLLNRVDQAHYDAVRAGLKELEFSLQLTTKGLANNMETTARGTWRAGKIELELTAVSRQGKEIKRGTGENDQVWGFAKDLTMRLLGGLGRGFLRPRIDEFIRLTGKVKRQGKAADIIFQDPDGGVTTFRIGEPPRIERISMASKDGVERAMSYQYQVEGDHNLVQEATLSASVNKGARYPKRIKAQIRRTNGTRYSFQYTKVGAYHLPSTLHRTTPRLTKAPSPHEFGEETLLKLSYTKAR